MLKNLMTNVHKLCTYIQVYQDTSASVEGGQYEVDENEDSMMSNTSIAGPSTTGPVQVKHGKLGNHILYVT